MPSTPTGTDLQGALTILDGIEAKDLNRKLYFVGERQEGDAKKSDEDAPPSTLEASWKLLGVTGEQWIPLQPTTDGDQYLMDIFRRMDPQPDSLTPFFAEYEKWLDLNGGQPDNEGKSHALNFKFCLWDPSGSMWRMGRMPEDEHQVQQHRITTSDELDRLTSGEPAPTHLFDTFNLDGVARYIQEKDPKKVIVMCGAGISVAAGIPDFRTPGTGLYANLAKYDLPYPEAVFTLSFLKSNPEVFVKVSKDMKLWPGSFKPTHIHRFIRLLQDEGRLLRCFTQNVDCLERSAGVRPELLVEAHGTFASASCLDKKGCGAVADVARVRKEMDEGDVPLCAKCGGLVKPDVVFFGENLPFRFFEKLHADTVDADLLIVMGTSMNVYPFASLADRVPKHVPRVLINNQFVGDFILPLPGLEVPGTIYRDVFLKGDGQEIIQELAMKLGWSPKMAELENLPSSKI